MERQPWPAEAIEMRPLASLRNYERNARTHSESQIRQLAESITEWGFTIPILVDEAGEIIAGHGRAMAAASLELEAVPVMVARGWTQKQIKAYRIADNQLALNAAWNIELLSAELGELAGLESLMGFSDTELTAMLTGEIDSRPLPSESEARHTLAARFGVPPFSVLSARDGWWQERKRAWLALGIESELGRGDGAEWGPNTPHDGKAMADGLVAARQRQKREKGALETSDTVKRLKPKAAGRRAETSKLKGGLTFGLTATPFGQEAQNETRKGQRETNDLRGGLTHRTTLDPYRARRKEEKLP